MKERIEPHGIHYYCRKSGVHILLDEIKAEKVNYSKAPRTVSIAITDECDFSCSYCYVKLKDRYLNKQEIITFCQELDRYGTFDIAFGGGEPTLHPDLVDICKTIWNTTELGISITTHGHLLNEELVNAIVGYISFIRVSIDGKEPIYSQLRKKRLADLLPKLLLLKGKIPFGINTVVNRLNVHHLDDVKSLFLEYGALELLLLPMWHKGKYILSTDEWRVMDEWIEKNYEEIPIRISSTAKDFLSSKFLFDDNKWDNDYAFIGIDKTLRKNSFTSSGLEMDKYESFELLLEDYNQIS